jgi:hypothetical protein
MALIPMAEAAKRLGYHPFAIRRALEKQGIPLVRQGGAWYVDEADLARAEHRPKHRPKAPVLIEQIEKHGVARVARACDDVAVATVLGLRDGIDVGDWQVKQGAGVVLFTRYDEHDRPVEGILWLNLREDDPEAEEFRQIAAEAGFPVTVLSRSANDVPY